MSWLRSKRSVATEAATAAMRPLLSLAQMNGGMSFSMWQDPYLLGYLSFVASFFAKAETKNKIKPEDLGYALQSAFASVSNMNGIEICKRAVELAESGDEEFQRGSYDATTVTLYSVNLLKDEEADPLVQECNGAELLTRGMFPDQTDRSAVSGEMMLRTFINRVKQLRRDYA